MAWLRRFLTPPLIVLASLLMWIEETLWVWLKRFTSWIAIFPLIRQFEGLLLRLPPYATMVAFLLPATLLIPVKLLAVYWLSQGYWLVSIATILGAKVLGTAIVARMFVVCRPKLMTIAWFRRFYDWVIVTRDRLHAALHALPAYQMVRARLSAIKLAVRQLRERSRSHGGLWGRWRAIRRLHRQRKA